MRRSSARREAWPPRKPPWSCSTSSRSARSSGRALHRLDRFLDAAEREGFRREEEIDLSRAAAPTVDYFLERLPRHRASLAAELDLAEAQIDALIESGKAYRDLYASGAYGYRLLRFRAPSRGRVETG